jgi:hypothetical protein
MVKIYRLVPLLLFLLFLSAPAALSVSSSAMHELLDAISQADFYRLRDKLNPQELSSYEREQLLKHAEICELKSRQGFFYHAKNPALIASIATSLAYALYSFRNFVGASFLLDSMLTHNQRVNEPVIIGFTAGPHSRPIFGSRGPAHSQAAIDRNERLALCAAAHALLGMLVAGVLSYQSLVGYYFHKPWYILNFLRQKFSLDLDKPAASF